MSAKNNIVTIIITFILFVGISALIAEEPTRNRTFVIEQKILLKNLPADASELRLWIPYPISDLSQEISNFTIELPGKSLLVIDKEYGNKFLYFNTREKALLKNLPEIILSFKVSRKEVTSTDNSMTARKNLDYFLKPNRLVPVNGDIRKSAKKITKGADTELEKARAIYDYIIDELTYSRDDPAVCGVGDSLLTLKHKKGICTDYHSLFISFVRSLGIPARFEIGFPIGSKKEGNIRGYHCWAKFYIKNEGWIAVDISEADKHPEKRDYFFGSINENRVHVSIGRDINLAYSENTEPPNFLVYPYAELDGREFNDIDVKVSYRDV